MRLVLVVPYSSGTAGRTGMRHSPAFGSFHPPLKGGGDKRRICDPGTLLLEQIAARAP
jgi:hypothetical protein